MKPRWSVEYNNDVSDDDGAFWEWFEVTDGEITFKTDKEENAEWLCQTLNNL